MFSGSNEPIAKNRLLVVSVDYDGCLGGVQFSQAYQKIQHLKDTAPQTYHQAYRQLLNRIHKPLIDDIIKKSVGCHEIQLMIGSNRQTLELDADNARKNQNGSCFEGIEQLANTLRADGRLNAMKVTTDLRVYGDAMMGMPPGHHASVHANQVEMGDTTDEAAQRIANYKKYIGNHKYCLSFLQITAVCIANPLSEVVYQFYDDLPEILAESENQFGQENVAACLPSNLVSVGFSQYQDSIILSDIAQLGEKIRKLKAAAAEVDATNDDTQLVLRVAETCAPLAAEFNNLISSDSFQSDFTGIAHNLATLNDQINAINDQAKIVKSDILKELSKNEEILQLVNEISAMVEGNCEYLDGKKNSQYIEKLQHAIHSLADDHADHSPLLTLLADPNLLHHIRLVRPHDDFIVHLNAFKKLYFQLKKETEAQRLKDSNDELGTLEEQKSAYDNLARFFKPIPAERIAFIKDAIASIEAAIASGSVVKLSTLADCINEIGPITTLLDPKSKKIIMMHGSKQHTNAIKLGFEKHLTATQELFDHYQERLYISADKMLAERQQFDMGQATTYPKIIEVGNADKLVLACTDQAVWRDINNLPTLNILYECALSAAILSKFESLDGLYDNLAVRKKNFPNTLKFALLDMDDLNKDGPTILALFAEFKKRDGNFAFLHDQKNKRWDAVRFKFKSNHNSGQGEQTFWHTDTYMNTIKYLKDTYKLYCNDDQEKLEAGRALIEYCRGNKIANPSQTQTSKETNLHPRKPQ